MNETNKASSGSDREVLTRVLHACILSIDETKAAQAADLCLAAGFTRAHHDGERVDEHDLDTTSVLGAMRGFVGAHTRPDGSHAKDVSMRLRPSTVWSVLAIVDRLTAERDALAARVAEVCGDHDGFAQYVGKYQSQADAAIARAESAEAEVGRQQQWRIDDHKRAAALADCLRDFIDDTPCRLDHHGVCQEHSMASGPCSVAAARAALAGNGTGEGA